MSNNKLSVKRILDKLARDLHTHRLLEASEQVRTIYANSLMEDGIFKNAAVRTREIGNLQTFLASKGFDEVKHDLLWGPLTFNALRNYAAWLARVSDDMVSSLSPGEQTARYVIQENKISFDHNYDAKNMHDFEAAKAIGDAIFNRAVQPEEQKSNEPTLTQNQTTEKKTPYGISEKEIRFYDLNIPSAGGFGPAENFDITGFIRLIPSFSVWREPIEANHFNGKQLSAIRPYLTVALDYLRGQGADPSASLENYVSQPDRIIALKNVVVRVARTQRRPDGNRVFDDAQADGIGKYFDHLLRLISIYKNSEASTDDADNVHIKRFLETLSPRAYWGNLALEQLFKGTNEAARKEFYKRMADRDLTDENGYLARQPYDLINARYVIINIIDTMANAAAVPANKTARMRAKLAAGQGPFSTIMAAVDSGQIAMDGSAASALGTITSTLGISRDQLISQLDQHYGTSTDQPLSIMDLVERAVGITEADFENVRSAHQYNMDTLVKNAIETKFFARLLETVLKYDGAPVAEIVGAHEGDIYKVFRGDVKAAETDLYKKLVEGFGDEKKAAHVFNEIFGLYKTEGPGKWVAETMNHSDIKSIGQLFSYYGEDVAQVVNNNKEDLLNVIRKKITLEQFTETALYKELHEIQPDPKQMEAILQDYITLFKKNNPSVLDDAFAHAAEIAASRNARKVSSTIEQLYTKHGMDIARIVSSRKQDVLDVIQKEVSPQTTRLFNTLVKKLGSEKRALAAFDDFKILFEHHGPNILEESLEQTALRAGERISRPLKGTLLEGLGNFMARFPGTSGVKKTAILFSGFFYLMRFFLKNWKIWLVAAGVGGVVYLGNGAFDKGTSTKFRHPSHIAPDNDNEVPTEKKSIVPPSTPPALGPSSRAKPGKVDMNKVVDDIWNNN